MSAFAGTYQPRKKISVESMTPEMRAAANKKRTKIRLHNVEKFGPELSRQRSLGTPWKALEDRYMLTERTLRAHLKEWEKMNGTVTVHPGERIAVLRAQGNSWQQVADHLGKKIDTLQKSFYRWSKDNEDTLDRIYQETDITSIVNSKKAAKVSDPSLTTQPTPKPELSNAVNREKEETPRLKKRPKVRKDKDHEYYRQLFLKNGISEQMWLDAFADARLDYLERKTLKEGWTA